MAGNKLLLDTNAVIALQQQDIHILKLLENEEDIFVPAIVIDGILVTRDIHYAEVENLRTLQW